MKENVPNPTNLEAESTYLQISFKLRGNYTHPYSYHSSSLVPPLPPLVCGGGREREAVFAGGDLTTSGGTSRRVKVPIDEAGRSVGGGTSTRMGLVRDDAGRSRDGGVWNICSGELNGSCTALSSSNDLLAGLSTAE